MSAPLSNGSRKSKHYRRTDNLKMTKKILDGNGDFLETRETSVNYLQAREEEDLLPDSSAVDLLDRDQINDVQKRLANTLQELDRHDMLHQRHVELSQLAVKKINFSHTSSSTDLPGKVQQFIKQLLEVSKPVRVRLKNY